MTSMPQTPRHLTEDEIDDALIGGLAADAAEHLSDCDPCQSRVEAAGAPIAAFNAVSLAWSERRSATLPLRPADAGRSPWTRQLAVAATAAVAMAVGASLPLLHRAPAAREQAQVSEPAQVADDGRAAQIERDNQMLAEIDRALHGSDDQPADALELQQTQAKRTAVAASFVRE